MNTLKTRKSPESRSVYSSLEVFDLKTGRATQLCEVDTLVEAPNWTRDGESLVYNADGQLFNYNLKEGKHRLIDSAFCTHCNNDHVLSPDGRWIGVSHHTAEDGESRLYVLPLQGGVPRLVTPLAPSYLHGWSADGKLLSCLLYTSRGGAEIERNAV